MGFLVNIPELVNGKIVEDSRLEFKRGWNPEEVMRTSCAFANDLKEKNGGYIIIGVENDGVPSTPPYGVPQNQVDKIQQEYTRILFSIRPEVTATIEAVMFEEKWVIVIWVPAGEERPFSAPSKFGVKGQHKIYIRDGSTTREARPYEIQQLRELSKFRHFDDRVNNQASLNDIEMSLIQEYLSRTNSELLDSVTKIPFEELCLKMQIARGGKEAVRPLNIGLLLFSNTPEKFFPGCQTILVEITGEVINTKTFQGPIHKQIENILEYFQSHVIKESVRKSETSAEAKRFFNYPLKAIREAVVNALYHRGYDNPTPNEIRIQYDENPRIQVISYPGPLPPIDQTLLQQEEVTARNYRNIKLGDWLRNMRLAEKIATGIRTIRRSMEQNGSPRPDFYTDEEKTIFSCTLLMHQDWTEKVVHSEENLALLSNEEQLILELCMKRSTELDVLKTLTKQQIPKIKLKQLIQAMLKNEYLVESTSSKFFGLVTFHFYTTTEKGAMVLRKSF
jgi:ATP-dependent DNA helicase RecG